MIPKPLISVVFSFRNEEDVLNELIRRTRLILTQLKDANHISGFELVFVNDDSTDHSLEILLNNNQTHNDLRIINMSRNFGVFPCVMAGLAYSRGDVIIYMDADLQDPPEIFPQMLEAMRTQHADVVHTVRSRRLGESAFKLFLTKIGYHILNRYSTVPILEEAGDFKMLSRRAVNHLLQFKEIKPFMKGLVAWIGFKQVSVSYERQERFAGKSKFFILGRKAISNFLDAAVINFSSVPLRLASYCGLCAIFIALIVAIHAIFQKIFGHAVPGWTAIMIVTVFIGGVQLFCIGMIGLYLNSVHEQGKMRPLYIVESTHGLDAQNNPTTT